MDNVDRFTAHMFSTFDGVQFSLSRIRRKAAHVDERTCKNGFSIKRSGENLDNQ